MRIALISYEYPNETPAGGIGTYTFQLANLLAEAGVAVHVFAGSSIADSIQREGDVVVHRVKCDDPHQFRQAVVPEFSSQHLVQPFDLAESAEIHGNALEIKKAFPHLPLLVRLHAGNHLVESLKRSYVPLGIKLRFVLGALRRGRWDAGYWRCYRFEKDPDYRFVQLADVITAPSGQMRDWAIRNWRLPADAVKVLQNPILENSALKAARTDNEEKVILFYGRLNVLKGLLTITEAMAQLLKDNPSWTWIVAGDDGPAADGKSSMRSWMKQRLAKVLGQVRFCGSVPSKEVPALLQKCSIVVVPSLFESFSYVTLEAMYAGKSVVGSKGTGIAALIEEGTTGLLADPFRKIEWRLALQALIDDKSLRRNIGEAAAWSAEERQEENKKLVLFYKHLLSKKKLQHCD